MNSKMKSRLRNGCNNDKVSMTMLKDITNQDNIHFKKRQKFVFEPITKKPKIVTEKIGIHRNSQTSY